MKWITVFAALLLETVGSARDLVRRKSVGNSVYESDWSERFCTFLPFLSRIQATVVLLIWFNWEYWIYLNTTSCFRVVLFSCYFQPINFELSLVRNVPKSVSEAPVNLIAVVGKGVSSVLHWRGGIVGCRGDIGGQSPPECTDEWNLTFKVTPTP